METSKSTPNLYTVDSLGGGIEDHQGIFISKDGKVGTIYHAVGNVRTGFQMEIQPNYRPEESPTYIHGSLKAIGRYDEDIVKQIAQSVPPPPGGQTRQPFRNCRSWVAEVLDQLQAQSKEV